MENSRGSRSQIVAFVGAFSVFCSFLEFLIPRPIPFLRLGLANFPVLLMLRVFSPRDFLKLAFIKVLGQALLNGTLLSYVFLFSLAGTVASYSVMYGLRRQKHFSLVGLSMLGSACSHLTQGYLAVEWIFGPAAWSLIPLLSTLGLVNGLLIGFLAQGFQHFCAQDPPSLLAKLEADYHKGRDL